MCYMSKTH
uniref:Uncharacterized protein n=1 Tax=Anguilla anguilla TaxID=7936 RepID=A0A0E9R018_ANGAN